MAGAAPSGTAAATRLIRLYTCIYIEYRIKLFQIDSFFKSPVRVGWYFDLNNLIDLFYRSFFVASLDLIKMDLYGKSFFQQCLYDFLSVSYTHLVVSERILKEGLEFTDNRFVVEAEVLRKVKELNNRITDDDNCIVFIGKISRNWTRKKNNDCSTSATCAWPASGPRTPIASAARWAP